MKTELPYNPSLSGDFIDMDYKKFHDMCGGEISVALFKGELKNAVWSVIAMAHERGRKYQHEQDQKFLNKQQ